MTPGLYTRAQLNEQEDHLVPTTLSPSTAATLVNRSPLHAWHQKFIEKPVPTEAMDRGTLAHALLLGQADTIGVVQAKDWRTNAAKEQRDCIRAEGKLPVLADKLEEAVLLAEATRKNLTERGILLVGESEVTAVWEVVSGVLISSPDLSISNNPPTENLTVWCRGRLDHWIAEPTEAFHSVPANYQGFLPGGLILDLKFVSSAQLAKCERHLIEYGGDIQWAAYTQAIERIFPEKRGRVDMLFIFVEVDPPFALRVCPLAGSMKALGAAKWARAVDLWARFMQEYGKEKPWPAYLDDGQPAECPAWAMTAELEAGE